MAADGALTADPALVGPASAIIGAALAWLGARLVGKAAIQEAVNHGFRELMDQLRQELRVALRERDAARAESEELGVHIEELQKTISALELRLASMPIPRVG